jgi:hypothetical protein
MRRRSSFASASKIGPNVRSPQVGEDGIGCRWVCEALLLDLLQAIGLLPNVREPVDRHVTPAEKPDGPLRARRAARVGALGFGMELVLAQNVVVGLHASDVTGAVWPRGRDLGLPPRGTVDA